MMEKDLMVVWNLSKPVGCRLFNFRSVARKLAEPSPDENCPCRRLFPHNFRPNGECVFTGDSSIISNKNLRKILELGPKFREYRNEDPFVLVKTAVNNFLEQWNNTLKLSTAEVLPWKSEVIHHFSKILTSPNRYTRERPNNNTTRAWTKYLTFIKKYLVLVPIDKATDTTGFICSRLYCELIRVESEKQGSAYREISSKGQSEIIIKLLNSLREWKIKGTERLPITLCFT